MHLELGLSDHNSTNGLEFSTLVIWATSLKSHKNTSNTRKISSYASIFSGLFSAIWQGNQKHGKMVISNTIMTYQSAQDGP